MEKRRAIALGLAFLSFLLAGAFGVLTAVCGGMEEGESTNVETGETTSYGPRCVSAFYPLVPVWAALALLGMASIWFDRPWPVVILGAIGLALGVVAGFSAGFFGIGCGALLLAAGLVGRQPRRPTN